MAIHMKQDHTAAASGHTFDALDLWINGEADCARRLAMAACEAELVIVEGVMGAVLIALGVRLASESR